MNRPIAHRRIAWCNRFVEWTASAAENEESPAAGRNVTWSYQLDGMTYFGFEFDPGESETTTTQRALNWLNRHHLIVRREHLAREPLPSVR